jgi:hypothetical protein
MPEAAETKQPTTSAGPDLSEVRSWLGSRLDAVGGTSVGKLVGAYVNEEGERPEWLLVRLGRFGNHALVPAREAVGGVGHVWVPYHQDAIKRAPKVDTRAPLTRERELELLAHYGIAGGVGRASELAERDSAAITARPAD